MTKDATPKNWTGLLTAYGGRLYSDPSNSPGAGGGGGAFAYSWDDEDPDLIVDPARTSNGTGSEASPYQPSQAFALNPNGQQAIFEWLPGNLDYTDARGSGLKYPRWTPQFSGASGNPIIHRARYKAADPAVNSSNYTSIRRVGGLGSILGPGNGGSTLTDIYFDGFNLPTWAGSAGAQSETMQYSTWDAARCKGVRLRIDGESAGAITVPSNNYGGVWHQNTDDCELADCLIQNIGSTSGTQIWSGAEHYACQGLNIHHCDFINIRGQGIFQKGEGAQINSGNRYHHNRLSEIRGNNSALFQFVQETGTNLANASWWYQNLVYDCDLAVKTNSVSGFSSGVYFVNNTFARCGNGFYFNNFSHDPSWFLRNNIWFDVGFSYYPEDGTGFMTYAPDVDIDYNRHFGSTGVMSNDGTRNLAFVQSNYGVDPHGQSSNPAFTDAANDDFRRAFDELGIDILNLLGGGTGAAINQGAFILPDQSDRIGRRF